MSQCSRQALSRSCYDYRINGRRETLVIGQYGRDGIRKIAGAETFAVYTDAYMKHVILADSTRAMKQSVIERDILPALGNKMMT